MGAFNRSRTELRWGKELFTYKKKFDGYQLENVLEGPGGTIFYSEQGGRLPFYWQYIAGGSGVSVPPPELWDRFCEKHGLSEGKGRRDEILTRVAKYVIMWYGAGLLDRLLRRKIEGDYEIGDHQLTVHYYSV